MRLVSYFMIGIITYLLQGQFFPNLFRTGWQPDLFLVWVVLISLIKGRTKGMIAAVIGGIIRDVVIGNFFGLHLFPYMAVAYVASIIGQEYYEEQWYRSIFAVMIATLFDGFLRYIMLFFVFPDKQVLAYFWYNIWPSLWMNALLGIFVHHITWRVSRREEYFW